VENLVDSKHAYIVHAEANAVLNAMGRNMTDATLYCALPTCNECAKLIIQVGIKRMVYIASEYEDRDSFRAAVKMFDAAGVKCEKYDGPTDPVLLSF